MITSTENYTEKQTNKTKQRARFKLQAKERKVFCAEGILQA